MAGALALVPLAAPAAPVGEGATIHKQFILHDGSKGDPYTLFYPIELTGPGEIAIYARAEDLVPEPRNREFEPLRVVLVDARAFRQMEPAQWRQWVQKANKFNPVEWVAGDQIRGFVKGVSHLFGKKEKPPKWFHGQMVCGREGVAESIRHAVDDPERAATGGKYVVILRNVADLKATGNILIRYPGEVSELDPEVEQAARQKPDLVVDQITLNTRGQVLVQVSNRGQGALRPIKWEAKGPEAVTLLLEVEGRSYGVTLPLLDPGKALQAPGGSVRYLFERATLSGPARVTATIDASDRAVEVDERNNRRSEVLEPRSERHRRDRE